MSEQTAVRTRKNGIDNVKVIAAYWSYWDISFRVRRRRIFCQRMTCISGSIRRSIISMCRCSLPIFLMHTLFAAPTRAVLLKVGVTNAAAHVVLDLEQFCRTDCSCVGYEENKIFRVLFVSQ